MSEDGRSTTYDAVDEFEDMGPIPDSQVATVKDLRALIKARKLVRPVYQRPIRWKPADMGNFIYSLFKGSTAGQITLVIHGTKLLMTDGQQRIEAITRFMNNSISMPSPYGSTRWSIGKRKGSKIIPVDAWNRILRAAVFIVTYPELSDESQRELFQALQLGKPLGLSDKVHASFESRRKLVVERAVTTYSDRLHTKFAFKPAGQENLEVIMARILYLTQTGNRTVPAPRTLLKWIGANGKLDKAKVDRMWEGMDTMIEAMQTPEARMDGEFEFNYSLAPVDILLCTLFAFKMHAATRGHECQRLAQGFRELRERLRRDFPKNVRTNSNILRYGLQFVDIFMRAYPPDELPRSILKREIKSEHD